MVLNQTKQLHLLKPTSPTAEATPTESTSATVSTTAAPLGIVAHYTADGATIFWDQTTCSRRPKGLQH